MPTFVKDPPEHVNLSKLTKVHTVIIEVIARDMMKPPNKTAKFRDLCREVGPSWWLGRVISFHSAVVENLAAFQSPLFGGFIVYIIKNRIMGWFLIQWGACVRVVL